MVRQIEPMEQDQFPPCAICGGDPHGGQGCLCPECPTCWEQGNLDCWGQSAQGQGHIPITLPNVLRTFCSVPAEWLREDQPHIPSLTNSLLLRDKLASNQPGHPLLALALALLEIHLKTQFSSHVPLS